MKSVLSLSSLIFVFMVGEALVVVKAQARGRSTEIETLVSQLSAPTTKEVFSAIGSLFKKGEKAFPYLVEHAYDKRLAFKTDHPNVKGAAFRTSVGTVCRCIIQDQLEVYRKSNVGPPEYPNYYGQFVLSLGLEDWWEDRENLVLWELQAEAVEWAIDKQRSKLKTVKDRNSDTAVALKEAISVNEALLKKLRDEKLPLPKRGLREHWICD